MSRLGISVYPEDSSLKDIKTYMKVAADLGYSIVFTLLRSENEDSFIEVAKYAQSLGMEIFSDCTPQVLSDHNISDLTNLENISNLNLSGVRLDAIYSGREEARMSYNFQNLKVILNASVGISYLKNVIENNPNRDNLITYHNFYPKKYTGLSRKFTYDVLKFAKTCKLRTGAFISSHSLDINAPGPVIEGLCTIEDHRTIPLSVQFKELLFSGLVDDIIIGNAFASKEELELLSELNNPVKTLRISLEQGIDNEMLSLLKHPLLELRYDYSNYMHRVSTTRGKKIETWNNNNSITKGDITLDNKLYESYSGEIGIALQDMEKNIAVNKVARIIEEEMILLESLKPGDKIRFEVIQR